MKEIKSPTMKSRRRTSKRKPFTDLTNTIPSSLPSSQSSSSSLLKPPTKSSFSLLLKSIHNNNHPNTSNSKFTATQSTANNNHNGKKKKEKEKGPSNMGEPSSALFPPLKKTTLPGVGDCIDFEPCTVYNRRHTAEKRKSKGKEIAEPLSCSFEMRMPDLRTSLLRNVWSYNDDLPLNIGLCKSCHPMRQKKKQRQEKAEVNASNHDLPLDFIDKQRAYFAEVDAFELEEEVASADELD